MEDKIKQFIALIGGFVGALYLALQASGISAEWIKVLLQSFKSTIK
ncbi:hypothetical protein QS432_13050 [Staphylococcus pseudintermedius]|nr:hypothetical protein [Staphylococcus pseudintermedius]WMZ83832.1 hypothetical protein QS432_13050 [Staphylococcus pseudintermedius]